MERHLTKVVSIHTADDWFELRGTRDKPVFSRVAYWAHVKFAYRDGQTGEYGEESDLIIGVTGYDVPLAAYDYILSGSPAGYIHSRDLLDGREIPFVMINNYVWDE